MVVCKRMGDDGDGLSGTDSDVGGWGGGGGANGARRARSLSISDSGGVIRTKMVCGGSAATKDSASSMVDLSGAGRASRLANRRKCPSGREGSRGKAASRALTRGK